jgi:hypothetical protein
MKNSSLEELDDVTMTASSGLTITWTTHDPTASTALTIADGSAPSDVENGVAIKSIVTILNQLVADVATLAAAIND